MNDYTNIKSTLPKNEIPYTLDENWKWYKWGDIIEDYQQGLIRSNSELNDDYSIEYFKMNFINENGDYSFKGLPKIEASQDEILRYKIREGDFFINVRNSRELVGKTCAIYNVLHDIVFNHMLVRIKHKNYITGTFMSAYFNTKFGKQILETCKKGTTTVIALYQKDLYNLPVPIPNEKLLKKIDKIYNNINKKIQLLHQINDNLAELAKTIYDYWFVQFDFPDENGKPYKSSGGKMVYNEVLKREIPQGWEVDNIFNVASIQYGFPFSTEFFNENKIGVPVIRIRDIKDNQISNFSTEEKIDSKYIIKKGEILIGMDGNFHINYWANDNCYLNQRVVKIQGIELSNIYLKEQIEPYIKTREKSISRTTVGHLSDKDLRSINIIIPNNLIMIKINSFYNNTLNKFIENLQQIQHLQSLRDWLLPMLMNGQISVE